jgi:N utilization substance protein B
MGKRRQAREMALQMLYQSDVGGSASASIFGAFDVAAYAANVNATETGERTSAARQGQLTARAAFEQARALVEGTLRHRDEIDGLIREQAEHWRLERMPIVDRNVLRLAVYELLFEEETPKVVIVDEAIELAKKFGGEDSGRFVNGLLDGLLKSRPFPGTLT